MRVLIAAAVAVSLSATSLLAADIAAPLAPGKAAGVKQAQDIDATLLWVAGGALVVGVIAYSLSREGQGTSYNYVANTTS